MELKKEIKSRMNWRLEGAFMKNPMQSFTVINVLSLLIQSKTNFLQDLLMPMLHLKMNISHAHHKFQLVGESFHQTHLNLGFNPIC
jgi:hypothetical protein